MVILNALPGVMLALVLIATVVRMAAVRRTAGVQAWAFGDASGAGQLAGLMFSLSLAGLGCAAVLGPDDDTGMGTAAVAGAIAAIGGALVTVIAQIQMGRAWRIGVRPGDAPGLIEHGLYRYSRNPIFAGLIAVGLGVALTSGLWLGWAALAALAVSCHMQIVVEEQHLTQELGPAYAAFCQRVPRWAGYTRVFRAGS